MASLAGDGIRVRSLFELIGAASEVGEGSVFDLDRDRVRRFVAEVREAACLGWGRCSARQRFVGALETSSTSFLFDVDVCRDCCCAQLYGSKEVELKVSVNCCDGCRRKVLKAVCIKGVLRTEIHPTLPRITVCGDVEVKTLIKRLAKIGKIAEPWPVEPKPENSKKEWKFESTSNSKDAERKGKVEESNKGNISKHDDSGYTKQKVKTKKKEKCKMKGNKSMNESSSAHTVVTSIKEENRKVDDDIMQPGMQGHYPVQYCPSNMNAYTPMPTSCVHGHCHCQMPTVYGQPQQAMGFTDYFNDENTVGCKIM